MQKPKPEIIQNLFLQQRFLKLFSKFKGPYVWFLKQELAVLKLNEPYLHLTDFCEWKGGSGGLGETQLHLASPSAEKRT